MQLPATAFKTYELLAPRSTHFRPANCAEMRCRAHVNGWKTIVPTASAQAQYIRAAGHGRRFHEERSEDTGMAVFVFPPGQTCFQASNHRKSLEREPLYVVRAGDRRRVDGGMRRVHARPQDWVEDFGEHVSTVVADKERG